MSDQFDSCICATFHGFSKRITLLPVEVPVPDVDEWHQFAISWSRGDWHFFAQQVHVWLDRDGHEIRGQFDCRPHFVIL